MLPIVAPDSLPAVTWLCGQIIGRIRWVRWRSAPSTDSADLLLFFTVLGFVSRFRFLIRANVPPGLGSAPQLQVGPTFVLQMRCPSYKTRIARVV